jgi:hypothetical protein
VPHRDPVLSTVDLATLAETISYKPGWRLVVHEPDPIQGVYLSIYVEMEDSYQPGSTVPLRIHSPIPPMPDEDAFLGWLAWRLKIIETHEVLEWLKVSGKPWIDPHASLD